jgi:hypothetical protein
VARDLSTKGLARRIHATYIQTRGPLRQKLRLLTWTLPIVGGVLIFLLTSSRRDSIYQPAPITDAHGTFIKVNDCARCHATWNSVPDSKCLDCHKDAADHHTNQVFKGKQGAAPFCADCHFEHRGRSQLTATSDRHCVQCHGNLETSPPKTTQYDTKITRFDGGHPEFAILREKITSKPLLNFDHQLHLNPESVPGKVAKLWPEQVKRFLKAKGNKEHATRGALQCTDCHEVDAVGRLMLPIDYVKHCQTCHALNWAFDDIVAVAPHEKPEVVHRSIIGRFFDEAEATRVARKAAEAAVPIIEGALPPDLAKGSKYYIQFATDVVERILVETQCGRCHSLDPKIFKSDLDFVSRVTVLTPVVMKRPWLQHARFSHIRHWTMACTACHAGVETSRATMNVKNIPSVKLCLECHSDKGGVRADCTTCHQYHDKTDLPTTQGKLQLKDMPQK